MSDQLPAPTGPTPTEATPTDATPTDATPTDPTPTDPTRTDAATPEVSAPPLDLAALALRGVVLEIERHAAEAGWDQPARLFALVRTEELLADQPELAAVLEVDPEADLTGSLTPVEQDELPDVPLEELLTQIGWPEDVHGTAVVVERLVLPPSVGELPEDAVAAQELAVSHPERQGVRMVAAVTRSGAAYCVLRLRSAGELVEEPDLVPALLQ